MLSSYSGEAFDVVQSLAAKLTELDRKYGKPAPPFGYSNERVQDAERMVNVRSEGYSPVWIKALLEAEELRIKGKY